ncbi:MAG TPA: metallophosphoesterase, partial [Thermoanaerobaculia bacterium]|nr:metallophosphoesterase [Thermoanaerobaculia bacterium]
FVVGLGDLVFHGSSRRDWEGFDALTAPLRAAGVPLLPVLGNHEYWARRAPALRNVVARFPRLAVSRWYAETYGPLRLLFLDSNERALGAAAWREEAGWLDAELARADAEEAVKGVVLFGHHPPYTNSTVTGTSFTCSGRSYPRSPRRERRSPWSPGTSTATSISFAAARRSSSRAAAEARA